MTTSLRALSSNADRTAEDDYNFTSSVRHRGSRGADAILAAEMSTDEKASEDVRLTRFAKGGG